MTITPGSLKQITEISAKSTSSTIQLTDCNIDQPNAFKE